MPIRATASSDSPPSGEASTRVDRQLVERVGERGQPVAQVRPPAAGPSSRARRPRASGCRAPRARARRSPCRGGAEAASPRRAHDHGPPPRARRPASPSAAPRPPARAARRAGVSPNGSSRGRAPRPSGSWACRPRAAPRTGSMRGAVARAPGRAPAAARSRSPQVLLEGEVDRVEHLAAAAEVDGDALRAPVARPPRPVVAEHADVRVAEAVDRLVLVARPGTGCPARAARAARFCSGFVSWNSSTSTWAKRPRTRPRGARRRRRADRARPARGPRSRGRSAPRLARS